jgi:hypothetical protein
LVAEYRIDATAASADVEDFIAQLSSVGLLTTG